MLNPFHKKGLAIAISSLVFATNCVLAYSSETNFWKERQDIIELASLPKPYVALNSLPASPPIPKPLPSHISEKRIQKWIKKKGDDPLKEILKSLPAQYGSIREVVLPKKNRSNKTVIHIQDVHMNQEAQGNIGAAIQDLIQQEKIDLVALEGAFGPLNISQYRRFPNQDSIQRVADYLLKENKISGPIHSAFTLGLPSGQALPPFIGIDDPAHYNANVEAVKQAFSSKDGKKKKVAELKKDLEVQKREIFNPDLLNFDLKITAYRNGTIGMGDYAGQLASYHKDLPLAVATFLEALKIESSLNFSQVEHERTALLNKLLKKIDENQTTTLMDLSVAFRLGQINHVDFYNHLKEMCENNGLNLRRFPSLSDYFQYVLLSDSIDVEDLNSELRKLEGSIYKELTQSNREKALIEKSRRFYLLGKLIEFGLTSGEWAEYSSANSEHAIREKNEDGIQEFENFYKEAIIRDDKISKNLTSAMNKKGVQVAVLVTGGFHSLGIQERLKKENITVVSWTPKLTKVDSDNGSNYLSVFAQEKTPLEKLFEGQKLFLASRPIISLSSFNRLNVLSSLERAGHTARRFGDFVWHMVTSEKTGEIMRVWVVPAGLGALGILGFLADWPSLYWQFPLIFSLTLIVVRLFQSKLIQIMPDWLYAVTFAGFIERSEIWDPDFNPGHPIPYIKELTGFDEKEIIRQLDQNQRILIHFIKITHPVLTGIMSSFIAFGLTQFEISVSISIAFGLGIGWVLSYFLTHELINPVYHDAINGYRLLTGGVVSAKRRSKRQQRKIEKRKREKKEERKRELAAKIQQSSQGKQELNENAVMESIATEARREKDPQIRRAKVILLVISHFGNSNLKNFSIMNRASELLQEDGEPWNKFVTSLESAIPVKLGNKIEDLRDASEKTFDLLKTEWFGRRGLYLIHSGGYTESVGDYFQQLAVGKIKETRGPYLIGNQEVPVYLIDLIYPKRVDHIGAWQHDGYIDIFPELHEKYVNDMDALISDLEHQTWSRQRGVSQPILEAALSVYKSNRSRFGSAYARVLDENTIIEEIRHGIDSANVEAVLPTKEGPKGKDFPIKFIETQLKEEGVIKGVFDDTPMQPIMREYVAEAAVELSADLTQGALGPDPLIVLETWLVHLSNAGISPDLSVPKEIWETAKFRPYIFAARWGLYYITMILSQDLKLDPHSFPGIPDVTDDQWASWGLALAQLPKSRLRWAMRGFYDNEFVNPIDEGVLNDLAWSENEDIALQPDVTEERRQDTDSLIQGLVGEFNALLPGPIQRSIGESDLRHWAEEAKKSEEHLRRALAKFRESVVGRLFEFQVPQLDEALEKIAERLVSHFANFPNSQDREGGSTPTSGHSNTEQSIAPDEWWTQDNYPSMDEFREERKPFDPALRKFVEEEIVDKRLSPILSSPADVRYVVEIGAGDGQLWEWAEKSLKTKFSGSEVGSWLQTDQIEEYLKLGDRTSRNTKVVNLREPLPFESESLSAIVTLGTLYTLPIPILPFVFSEIARCLKVGAPLIHMTDQSPPDRIEGNQAKREGLEIFPYFAELLPGVHRAIGHIWVDWNGLQSRASPDMKNPLWILANQYVSNPEKTFELLAQNSEYYQTLIYMAQWLKELAERHDALIAVEPSAANFHMNRVAQIANDVGLTVEHAGPIQKQYIFDRSETPDFWEQATGVIFDAGLFALAEMPLLPPGQVAYDLTVYLLHAVKSQPGVSQGPSTLKIPSVREVLSRSSVPGIKAEPIPTGGFPSDWGKQEGHEEFENRRDHVRPVLESLLAEEMVAHMGRGNTVLEVGAGQGGLLKLLSPHLPPNVHYVASDPHQQSLDNFRATPNEKVVASLPFLPFDNGSFDVVTGLSMMNTISNTRLEDSLREIGRVLKQGGKFAHFLDFVPDDAPLLADRATKGLIGIPISTIGIYKGPGQDRPSRTGFAFVGIDKVKDNLDDLSAEQPDGVKAILSSMVVNPEKATAWLTEQHPIVGDSLARLFEEHNLIEDRVESVTHEFKTRLEKATEAVGLRILKSDEVTKASIVSRDTLTVETDNKFNRVHVWHGLGHIWWDEDFEEKNPGQVGIKITGLSLIVQKPVHDDKAEGSQMSNSSSDLTPSLSFPVGDGWHQSIIHYNIGYVAPKNADEPPLFIVPIWMMRVMQPDSPTAGAYVKPDEKGGFDEAIATAIHLSPLPEHFKETLLKLCKPEIGHMLLRVNSGKSIENTGPTASALFEERLHYFLDSSPLKGEIIQAIQDSQNPEIRSLYQAAADQGYSFEKIPEEVLIDFLLKSDAALPSPEKEVKDLTGIFSTDLAKEIIKIYKKAYPQSRLIEAVNEEINRIGPRINQIPVMSPYTIHDEARSIDVVNALTKVMQENRGQVGPVPGFLIAAYPLWNIDSIITEIQAGRALIMQVPGQTVVVVPSFLGDEKVKKMDDSLDLSGLFGDEAQGMEHPTSKDMGNEEHTDPAQSIFPRLIWMAWQGISLGHLDNRPSSLEAEAQFTSWFELIQVLGSWAVSISAVLLTDFSIQQLIVWQLIHLLFFIISHWINQVWNPFPAVRFFLAYSFITPFSLILPSLPNIRHLHQQHDFISFIKRNNSFKTIEVDSKTGRIRFNDQAPAVELNFDYWVVRHGQTPTNKAKQFQGRMDGPLNQLTTDEDDPEMNGEKQARQAAMALYEELKDEIANGQVVIRTSPIGRAKRTVEIFVEYVQEVAGSSQNIEIVIDDDLIEIDFGDFDSKPNEEFSKDDMELVHRYRKGLDATVRFPKGDRTGENLLDVINRRHEALDKLNREFGNTGKIVVAFGHGCVFHSIRTPIPA